MSALHSTPSEPRLVGACAPREATAGRGKQAGKRIRLFFRVWPHGLCLLVFVAGLLLHRAVAADITVEAQSAIPASPSAQTEMPRAANIIDLQSFRQASSMPIRPGGGEEGRATLINLNPAINAWYVLEITGSGRAASLTYHLENARPRSQTLALDAKYPSGIVILEGKSRYPCELFAGGSTDALEQAKNSQSIYAGLCAGRVYLRNPAKGHRTTLEAATEFLRDQVWGGEKVIILFHHLLEDRNRETGELHASAGGTADAPAGDNLPKFPRAASVDPKYAGQFIASRNLEITLQSTEATGMRPGAWYPAREPPGIYVSLLQPNLVAPEILQTHRDLVSNLDSVEASALCYLVAFDLDQFDLAYALGTEHPAVDWSEHILEEARAPGSPGPDGIGSIAPLVSTGLINPEDARRTAAVFTAGFKRSHGAFKSGEFALKNHGSHYGFLENGVVLSRLQAGLSTIFARADGFVGMKTWEESDDKLLPGIKYARQNGVPLLEFDEVSQSGVPGRLVTRWGPGNWSGSEDSKLRTMRSGAALQQSGAKRFLIYAVFTSATPSAMVRVFQAYQCRYAMLLDMNALEHTYLAVFHRSDSQVVMEHLISGMGEVDKTGPDGPIPRFLGFPDNRDFFYMMRRTGQAGGTP